MRGRPRLRGLLRRMSKFLVAFIVVMSGLPPAPAPVPAPPSAHPGRSAPAEQPAPVHNPKDRPNKQWYVQAIVSRMGTGKAAGHQISEKSPKIFARTREEAVLKQQEFIQDYLHPKKRQKAAAPPAPAAVPAAASGQAASSSSLPTFEQAAQRPVRAAAPTNLKEDPLYETSAHAPIPGPGARQCSNALAARSRASLNGF